MKTYANRKHNPQFPRYECPEPFGAELQPLGAGTRKDGYVLKYVAEDHAVCIVAGQPLLEACGEFISKIQPVL